MFVPAEVVGEEDPKVVEGGDRCKVVAGPLVGVVAPEDVATSEVGSFVVIEDYQFSLGRVSREAIVSKPAKGELEVLDGSHCSGKGGGRHGIDGTIIDIEGEVTMGPVTRVFKEGGHIE